jgi:hypothetical protein
MEDESLASNRRLDLGTRPTERCKWVGKKKNISTALSKTWRSEPEDSQKAGEGSGLGGKGSFTEWRVAQVPRRYQ